MKNLTDYRKTVETGMDPSLLITVQRRYTVKLTLIEAIEYC